HLVDARVRGERRDVHVELLLERDDDLEAELGLADQAADLPEDRLLLARGRTERRGVDRALALGEQAQAKAAHHLPGALLALVGRSRAWQEDVADREQRVERQVRGVAAGADLLPPDLARDVEQHAAAVALAVDVAGAVKHLLERGERRGDRLVTR